MVKAFEPVVKLAYCLKGKCIRNAPELMVGAGIGLVVVGAVTACVKTLNMDDILDEAKEQLDDIKKKEDIVDVPDENGDVAYTKGDHQKDVIFTYAALAGRVTKNYAVPFACGAVGIGLILGSHYVMTRRQAELIAAYTGLQKAYSAYRERVIEKYGEEEDAYFRTGLHDGVAKIVNEDGKRDVIDTKVFDGRTPSDFARWFDESSQYFSNDVGHNLYFLKATENTTNELLRIRGYVTLNEVYDKLGIPRCPAGQVLGWVKNGDAGGKGVVSFGLYNGYRESNRDFINGYEKAVLLDFNIDPEPILDYIGYWEDKNR